MVDTKKNSSSTELVQSELQELTETNQQLKNELDVARSKLGNELDLLTYKLEKTQSDIQDIRRDVHEINLTIERLRHELIEAVRKGKSSEIRDMISSFFPLFAIMLPVFVVLALVLIFTLAG